MGVYIASVSGSSWQFKQWPWYSRRAAARAVGVRRPLLRGRSSVRIDEHTANTSAKWCASRGQQLEEVSSQGSVRRGYISRHSLQPDYRAIPPAMQATGKASGPGPAHYRRVGAPTGRMTARPKSKQRKMVCAIEGWCLIVCKRLKGQPHGVQDAESEIHGVIRDKRVRSTTKSSGV